MRKKTAEKSQLGIITGQTTDILTPAGLKGRLHVRSQLRVQMFALSDLRNIFKLPLISKINIVAIIKDN